MSGREQREQKEAAPGGVGRSAAQLLMGNLTSRLLGFLREILYAHFFGAGHLMDAFFVAQTIPAFLERSFGEGASTVAVIRWHRDLRSKGRATAAAAFRLLSWRGLLLLGLACIFQASTSESLVRLLAPGFGADDVARAARLTVLLAPLGIGLVGRKALSGLLTAQYRFPAVAATPVLINITLIAVVTLFHRSLGTDAIALGLLAANLIGLGFLALAARSVLLAPAPERGDRRAARRSTRNAQRLMLPIVGAATVGQLGLITDRFLASSMGPGSVSALFYAWRLLSIPAALLTSSIPTAVYPRICALAAANDNAALTRFLGLALRGTLLLLLPAACTMFALREPLVRVVFQHGAFDAQATRITASVLGFYLFVFVAQVPLTLFSRTYHALADTTTPVVASTVTMFLNIGLSIALARPMGVQGLALATAIAELLNLGASFLILRGRLGPILDSSVWWLLLKASALALAGALAARSCFFYFDPLLPGWAAPISFAASVLLALLLYSGALLALRVDEAWQAWARGRRLLGW